MYQREVSRKDPERVVGHCTCIALALRPALSVPYRVYAFINKYRTHEPVSLWLSVRQELENFCSDGTSEQALCTDALEWGYRVVAQRLPPTRVKKCTKSFGPFEVCQTRGSPSQPS